MSCLEPDWSDVICQEIHYWNHNYTSVWNKEINILSCTKKSCKYRATFTYWVKRVTFLALICQFQDNESWLPFLSISAKMIATLIKIYYHPRKSCTISSMIMCNFLGIIYWNVIDITYRRMMRCNLFRCVKRNNFIHLESKC